MGFVYLPEYSISPPLGLTRFEKDINKNLLLSVVPNLYDKILLGKIIINSLASLY